MISCQLCKIFKNIFFIEHLRWLLLAILKLLDSQRQLCKWISKLAMIYFISTFCWNFCINFCISKFGVHRPCESGNVTFSICHVTTILKCHVTLWFGSPNPKFGVHRPCESGDATFLSFHGWCVMLHGWYVTWFRSWGPLILSHHPAKFGVHRPCESGDITFFICHVITISKSHVTLWEGSSHLKLPTT